TDRGAFHDVEAAARFCTLRVTRIVATVPTRDGLAKSRFRRAQLQREPLRGRSVSHVSHVSHANFPWPLDYRSGEGEFSGTGRRTRQREEADRSLLRRNEAVRRDEAVARRHDPAALRAQPRHGVDVRHLVSSASCLAASFVLTRGLIAQYSLAERDHHPSRSRAGGLTWRTRGEQRQGA